MDYQGKIAAITGAANGIGREVAIQCAAKGMKLSLCDIDATNLAAVENELKAKGAEVISTVFDVRDMAAFKAFADQTIAHYGAVDLFFNNAGVAVVGCIWEMSEADWKWGLETNVNGLVHGIKAFVPFMMSQDKECRVINTASIGGMLISPNSPNYIASKHAAVALSEVFAAQLLQAGSKVKASVYCPGFIVTDLHNSDRHRPVELQNDSNDPYYQSEDYMTRKKGMEALVLGGIQLEDAIQKLFQGIEADKFYILTHPEYVPIVAARHKAIMDAMPS